ncbi:biotin--[acetyl-CoA-carboxylase] ligase [Acidithiobacillus sp. IBUN Pt1247-S3]|uniref:biotin--[acetyl-CoA-carboxylase] ligase n=1 Tax=Acidithiobacillus sp. IBUN Pt1247-S3 TaxID=3166642 RepID=UPI0034E388F3
MNGANWEQEARRWGIPLVAHNGLWKVEHPERHWEQQSLASALGLQKKKEISIWPLCDSSNTRLLEDSGLRLGIAEAQWSGHGRRGRAWHSSFGKHLYCSMAVEISAEQASVLPLVAGLGIYQVLHQHLPTLWLKWPNDLWIEQQKVAGLLLEGRHGASGQHWVLGCGINVLADPELPAEATSLAHAGYTIGRQQLLVAILQQWQEDFARLRKDGFSAFRQRWQQADRLCGSWVELEMAGEVKPWRVLDVDNDGGLQIDDGFQQQAIHAGEVRLRPRP